MIRRWASDLGLSNLIARKADATLLLPHSPNPVLGELLPAAGHGGAARVAHQKYGVVGENNNNASHRADRAIEVIQAKGSDVINESFDGRLMEGEQLEPGKHENDSSQDPPQVRTGESEQQEGPE